MIRSAVFLAVVLVSGCSTWGGSGGDAPDRYEYAANSWIGARIEDMVAAWGTPNRGYKPPEGTEPGIAGWGTWAQTGIGENKSYRYRCETLAYFGSDGIIVRIVVKHSRNCARPYEGQFEKMTRPAIAPITT